MTLPSSGQISLGANVDVELGLSATTQINMGNTLVRTLYGIPSGAIRMAADGYGKSSCSAVLIYFSGQGVSSPFTKTNSTTRINKCGAQVGAVTNVGTYRFSGGGTTLNKNAVFYAGCNVCLSSQSPSCQENLVTRINKCAALVGSETTVTRTTKYGYSKAAYAGSNGVWYSGAYWCSFFYVVSNVVTRINACGAKVGSCGAVGTARYCVASSPIGSNAVFYTGRNAGGTAQNTITRINTCGALVGSETAASAARRQVEGAKGGAYGLFYGGYNSGGTYCTLLSRINTCGGVVGSDINLATGVSGFTAATPAWSGSIGSGCCSKIAVFRDSSSGNTARIMRVNGCGGRIGCVTAITCNTFSPGMAAGAN